MNSFVIKLKLKHSIRQSLKLKYSVANDISYHFLQKIELKKDGGHIKVTADNRMEYIQLYVNYYLSKRVSSFRKSFIYHDLCPFLMINYVSKF